MSFFASSTLPKNAASWSGVSSDCKQWERRRGSLSNTRSPFNHEHTPSLMCTCLSCRIPHGQRYAEVMVPRGGCTHKQAHNNMQGDTHASLQSSAVISLTMLSLLKALECNSLWVEQCLFSLHNDPRCSARCTLPRGAEQGHTSPALGARVGSVRLGGWVVFPLSHKGLCVSHRSSL
jgi:hypothetical protein